MDYPFQIAFVHSPPPLRKNRRRGVCGAGSTMHRPCQSQTDNPFLALVWKRLVTKFRCSEFLMIAKDWTERLSAFALSMHRPHYSARLMRFGSRGPSEFFSQIHHRNAFTETAWEDAEQGLGMAMSTLASEKNRALLFIGQRVFQQVTSLGVVSLVFRGRDLLKIANFNPQQEARFLLLKISVPRESGGTESRSMSQLNGAWPNVRTESK